MDARDIPDQFKGPNVRNSVESLSDAPGPRRDCCLTVCKKGKKVGSFHVYSRRTESEQCPLLELNVAGPCSARMGYFNSKERSCVSFRRVMFGVLSSLERIGASCFESSGVEEVSIPDGPRELCDHSFEGCWSLHRVTFGSSASVA